MGAYPKDGTQESNHRGDVQDGEHSSSRNDLQWNGERVAHDQDHSSGGHDRQGLRERGAHTSRSPPNSHDQSRLACEGHQTCWELAQRLVGDVTSEEANASLAERFSSLQLKYAPATTATNEDGEIDRETETTLVEGQDEAGTLEYLLSADEDGQLSHGNSNQRGQTNWDRENDRPSTEDGPKNKARRPFVFGVNDLSDDDSSDDDASDRDSSHDEMRVFDDDFSRGKREEQNNGPAQDDTDLIRGVAKLLESGRRACAGVDGRPVVLVVGPTGAGKSLLINAIDGRPFEQEYNESLLKWVYVVKGEELPGFPIGNSLRSETRHVRAYHRRETGTYYVDSSGFGDNQCSYNDIATSLSVQDLAKRCSKLRIAVLVNALTFYTDRAGHLRALLDLVKEFVGDRFRECRESFTFVFTHCQDAYAVAKRTDKAVDVVRLRQLLTGLLNAVQRSENDRDACELIDFMRSSSDDGQHFCDIFEPGLSDISDLCQHLEQPRYSFTDPGSTVRCALTPSSKVKLNNEIKSRTQAVKYKLENQMFDDELEASANDVMTLAGFIKNEFCAEHLLAMTKQLKEAKKRLDEQIRDLVHRGVKTSDPTIPFTLDDARAAKEYIDGLNQISGLVQACEGTILHASDMRVCDESESQSIDVQDSKKDVWSTVLEMLRERGEWIGSEFAKAKSYLTAPESHGMGSASKPDCTAVCVVLQKLRTWGEVFKEEMMAIVSAAVKSVITGLWEAAKALKLLESEENAAQKAYGYVRITAFLKGADTSGLLDSLFSQTDVGKSKRAHFDRTADEARSLAKQALSDVCDYITTKQQGALSEPVDLKAILTGEQVASSEYGQLLGIVDDLIVLISSADLSDELACPISRWSVTEGTMVTFRQHWIVCDRMASALKPETASCLEPCLCCLYGIASSMPPALLKELLFLEDLDVLVQKFAAGLGAVVSSVERNTAQAAEKGVMGDVTRNVTLFSTLRAGLWLDTWLKEVTPATTVPHQFRASTFFRKAYEDASSRYLTLYDGLSRGLQGAFDNLLSDTASSRIVEHSAHVIVGSWVRLISCRQFIALQAKEKDTAAELLSRLNHWCVQQAEVEFPDNVAALPFDKVDRVLHVAICLKDADFKEEALDRLAISVASRLKGYHASVMEVVRDGRHSRAKAELLEASRSWSQFPMLRNHLPDYAELRRAALRSFEESAQAWLKHVEDTTMPSEINAEDVGDLVQHYLRLSPSLDSHFDGSMKSWANRIASALEIRLADLDEKLKGLVADNDWDGVLAYLSNLQAGPASSLKSKSYEKCISVIAEHWVGVLADLRSRLGGLKVADIPEMRKLIKILEEAANKLGVRVGTVQSWGGTLSDELLRFDADICAALLEALDQARNAARSMEYGYAHTLVERASMLKEIARPIDRDLERNLQDVQQLIASLLPSVSTEVDKFLESMAESKHPDDPGLPDTTVLLEALRKLKMSVEREECPSFVKESYEKERKKLSDGISALYDSLQSDVRDMKFSRPRRLLSYLRDQMEVKGMKEHLTLDFDIVVAMKDLTDAESKLVNSMRMELYESTYVDVLARRLDALRTEAASKFWRKQDYEDLRRTLSDFATDVIAETDQCLSSGQFMGMRSRFAVIATVRTRLGAHIARGDDVPRRLISNGLRPRLSQLETDLKRHLADDAIHMFDQSFNRTLLLFDEIPREHTSGETKKISSILDAYDSLCRQLRTSLHEMMASRVEALISEFQGCVDRWEFDSAATMVSTLQAVGQFLATSFEAYRCNHCHESDDEHLERLNRLNREHFSNDDFLEFGRHLSAFHLPTTASFSDVEKSYEILRERWEPSKNPSDNRAQLRFRVINDAWVYLSGNVAQFKAFEGYEFNVVVTTISGIGQKVKFDTESLIESGEFETLRERYRRLRRLEDLVREVRGPRIVDAEAVKNDLVDDFRSKVDDLQFAVERAWTDRDSSSIHHAMTLIEAIEDVFRGDLGRTSVISDILLKQRKHLKELKDTITRVDSSMDESTAFSRMADFGEDLISIGRVMDCFARLKQEGEDIIRRLLDEIVAADWGETFIFQLGVKLDSGEIVRDDAGNRIVRLIVTSLPHFKDVRTRLFNTEVVSAPVGESIAGSESFRYTRDYELDREPFETEALTDAFKRYKTFHDKFYHDNVSNGTDKLVEEVCTVARKFGRGGVRNWQESKRHLVIEVLAGVFATFTILKSGDIFKKLDVEGDVTDPKMSQKSALFSPHNVQVLAVLRLLGIASKDARIENHIMEVRTGEGKSVILGALATVLALVGFQVRCVCYSEHLSERDRELFEEIFVAFGVQKRITYSKINTMSEASVADIGDIRQLTTDLIKGSTRSATEEKRRGRGRSDRGKEKRRGPTWLGRREGPNELNGEDVLLVDEVDVFFGADFYGETHKMVAQVDDPTVERLIRKIWDRRREKPTASVVKRWPEYERVVEQFPGWRSLIEKEVRCMCSDVGKFDSPSYEVDEVNCRIGYTVMDSVDWEATYGYRTAFAFLNEQEQGTFRTSADLGSELSLRVSCGQFSYANVKPTLILGVSGTVRDLCKKERSIVKEMGVTLLSLLPSVYGQNNLVFDVGGRGIVIEEEVSRYHQSIADQIKKATDKGGAALVFFEDDDRLLDFRRSSHWRNIRNGLVLDSRTKKENRDYIIRKAATSRQVTLATAPFGRGTDFFMKDRKLEESGGMVVVQTFLSCEKSEETQIKGRTARQGKRGSYVMVLLESDLCDKFGIEKGEVARKGREELYSFLDEKRRAVHETNLEGLTGKVKEAEELDVDSRRYLGALVEGNGEQARVQLMKMYETLKKGSSQFKFSRMICLSDATGSMDGIWSATRDCITEMLRRIDEIGDSQFELMWVAYRDYSDGGGLLENSRWTKDPSELVEFVNGIRCYGGGDYPEAVEEALRHVNQETAKQQVTRALLIADAPPHPETKGQTLTDHRDRVMETDYMAEAKQLSENKVPVNTFRLNDEPSLLQSFNQIAEMTGGKSLLLDVSRNGSNALMDIIAETALEDIGGKELVLEYRSRYSS